LEVTDVEPAAAPSGGWLSRAVASPLMRGGLVITAGILVGNLLGFVRAGVVAYLLGTHAAADSQAVAIGPIDTLNQVLINTMVFAFVPLLSSRKGGGRAQLFRRAARLFTWVFCSLSAAIVIFAPWLVHVLGPGLDASLYHETVTLLRIASLSTLAAGAAALQSALLYTERRFAPSAFNQAVINAFVIAGALLLWKPLGVYSLAVGYTTGAFVQLVIVTVFARRSWTRLEAGEVSPAPSGDHTNAELLSKPGSFLIYAGLLAMNIIVTRAYATQAGPGMAAALDYCMRCVSVVTAYLVSPASNSLLPEIARLRSTDRARQAFRLMNRVLSLTAVAAVLSCAIGIAIRQPVIAILFERGNFTAESTQMVSAVFLGFAPSLIGLSLLEILARSLFAMDQPWLPVIAAAVPLLANLTISSMLHSKVPDMIGAGASAGFLLGFAVLFGMVLSRRARWLQALQPAT
jgi:putative peptidoglycan lipid II flippase